MNKQRQQEAAFSPEPLWSYDEPVPQITAWDTADYLREERMIGLDAECASDDGNDYGLDFRDGLPVTKWDYDEANGYPNVIAIPGPLLTSETVELWRRIHTRILLGLPPETDSELIIRATRKAAIDQGLGKKVAPGALIIGCLLAVAKAEGVRIQTHPRDLAKDLGVRYSMLLLVRRLALAQIKRHGARLGLSVE